MSVRHDEAEPRHVGLAESGRAGQARPDSSSPVRLGLVCPVSGLMASAWPRPDGLDQSY